MAGAGIRRTRTTLLDQLSTMEPTILRDLLKDRDEDNASTAAGCRNSGAVTLASVLESEKSGGRTLLDIIREEDEARGVMPTESTPPLPEAEEGPTGRVSLMTLLALADGAGGEDSISGDVSGAGVAVVAVAEEEEEKVEAMAVAVADDRIVCCVCMVRRKGAAFIPCGHTFCRLCSRELWTGRGSCPLCNGLILDILDIF